MIFVTNTATTLPKSSSVPPLSDEETRTILTPFAFKIDESLFGLSLAKPWKRAVALFIDLFIIAILSDAPGELLAVVIAITLYRLGNKKRAQKQGKIKGNRRRAMLRGVGFFIIFITLLDLLPKLFDTFTDNNKQTKTVQTNDPEDLNVVFSNNPQALTLFSKIFINATTSDCESLNCWEKTFEDVPTLLLSLPEKTLNQVALNKVVTQVVDITSLAKKQRSKLIEHIIQQYKKKRSLQNAETGMTPRQEKSDEKMTLEDVNIFTYENKKPEIVKDNKPIYSIVKLVKGIIDDLGLGFGWAAFYFTVLTALWHGQTIGKKALGIKVLQLDGTPLTLSDSFGRYGGYGAGIATGMLGFIQIFWDPNRQAIHDKISSTVVIDFIKNT